MGATRQVPRSLPHHHCASTECARAKHKNLVIYNSITFDVIITILLPLYDVIRSEMHRRKIPVSHNWNYFKCYRKNNNPISLLRPNNCFCYIAHASYTAYNPLRLKPSIILGELNYRVTLVLYFSAQIVCDERISDSSENISSCANSLNNCLTIRGRLKKTRFSRIHYTYNSRLDLKIIYIRIGNGLQRFNSNFTDLIVCSTTKWLIVKSIYNYR